MGNKIATVLMSLWMSSAVLWADVSEMIFYPEADFSEAMLHFNYQGEKNRSYAFMFDRGFDPNRIVYVRPVEHSIEKQRDGTIKLSFENTDRYSYVQRAEQDDFLVSKENGVIKILLSGGDCKGSPDCVTAENILTVHVPKGYSILRYQGLDQDLKPLKVPQWQAKGNIYTLTARDVKGACVMMELEKTREGQTYASFSPTAPIVPKISPLAPKPVHPLNLPKPVVPKPQPVVVEEMISEKPTPKPEPIFVTAIPKPIPKIVPPVVVPIEKDLPEMVNTEEIETLSVPTSPSPYFRNFQLFSNRVVALNDAGKERLGEWVKLFKEGKYRSVIINSYTDNIPPQRLKHLYATNEIISEARGKVVAEYLVSLGIDADAIHVNGLGEANPVASNDTEEGRSKNRRIEFLLKR